MVDVDAIATVHLIDVCRIRVRPDYGAQAFGFGEISQVDRVLRSFLATKLALTDTRAFSPIDRFIRIEDFPVHLAGRLVKGVPLGKPELLRHGRHTEHFCHAVVGPARAERD